MSATKHTRSASTPSTNSVSVSSTTTSAFRQRLLRSTGKSLQSSAAQKANPSEATTKAMQQVTALEKKQVELLETQKVITEENERLKKKLAVMEAVIEQEREDPDKLSAWRLRMLKVQNLELQTQLTALKASLSTSKEARMGLLKTLVEFQAKAAEFKSFERIPEPRQKPESSPSSSTKKKSINSPGRFSLGSAGSPSSPATSRRPVSSPQKPSSPGHSHAGHSHAGHSHHRSPPAPTRSNTRLCQVIDSGGNDPDSPPMDAQRPPPAPKVAVEVSWLENGEEWASSVIERLRRVPEEILYSESIAGVTHAFVGGQNGKIEAEVFQDNVNPFMTKTRSENPEISEDAKSRVAKKVLDSLDFNRIHDLEVQLSEIHPGLIFVHGLLKSIILPSLPSSTVDSLVKELDKVNSGIYLAAKSLGELALVLPGKSTILGPEFDTRKSISFSLEDEKVSSFGDQKLPSFEEFSSLLAQSNSSADAAAQSEASEKLRSLINRIKEVEALWMNGMRGLQSEMLFYQGCHAVNAAHVKILMQSSYDILHALLGDAVKEYSAAAKEITTILAGFEAYQAEETEETLTALLDLLQSSSPALSKFVELLPEKLKAGNVERMTQDAANELLGPLEKSYKDQLKELFESLQASRNSKFSLSSSRSFPRSRSNSIKR